MKKHLITGLVLAAFALICGTLLAVVNHFTTPVIKAHEEEKIAKSISIVYEPFDSEIHKKVEFSGDGIITGYLIINKETEEKENRTVRKLGVQCGRKLIQLKGIPEREKIKKREVYQFLVNWYINTMLFYVFFFFQWYSHVDQPICELVPTQ